MTRRYNVVLTEGQLSLLRVAVHEHRFRLNPTLAATQVRLKEIQTALSTAAPIASTEIDYGLHEARVLAQIQSGELRDALPDESPTGRLPRSPKPWSR